MTSAKPKSKPGSGPINKDHAEHQPLKEMNREPPRTPPAADKPPSRIVAGDDTRIGRQERTDKRGPSAPQE